MVFASIPPFKLRSTTYYNPDRGALIHVEIDGLKPSRFIRGKGRMVMLDYFVLGGIYDSD